MGAGYPKQANSAGESPADDSQRTGHCTRCDERNLAAGARPSRAHSSKLPFQSLANIIAGISHGCLVYIRPQSVW